MLAKYIILAICILGLAVGGAAVSDEAAGDTAAVSSSTEQSPSIKPSEPGKPYTSIIVDVTGFDLERCMSPKLRTPDGKEVWGTIKYDCDYIQECGVCAYSCSIDEAKKNVRCGPNPVIVKAVAVYGKTDSDPVIASEDAKLLLSENEKGKFFDKCNVIFVKTPAPASSASKTR